MSTVLIPGGAVPSGHGRDESYRAIAQIKARGSRVIRTGTEAAPGLLPSRHRMVAMTGDTAKTGGRA